MYSAKLQLTWTYCLSPFSGLGFVVAEPHSLIPIHIQMSMEFNIIAPYTEMLHINRSLHYCICGTDGHLRLSALQEAVANETKSKIDSLPVDILTKNKEAFPPLFLHTWHYTV